jgi:hypothetical protein
MTRQVLEPLEGVLPPEATEVMRWAAQALIRAAESERGQRPAGCGRRTSGARH